MTFFSAFVAFRFIVVNSFTNKFFAPPIVNSNIRSNSSTTYLIDIVAAY